MIINTHLCWVCKVLNPDWPAFTGACGNCRIRLGDSLVAVHMNGEIIAYGSKSYVGLDSFKKQLEERFADDTGFYHQFNGGNHEADACR